MDKIITTVLQEEQLQIDLLDSVKFVKQNLKISESKLEVISKYIKELKEEEENLEDYIEKTKKYIEALSSSPYYPKE
jgi:hypothetical protein